MKNLVVIALFSVLYFNGFAQSAADSFVDDSNPEAQMKKAEDALKAAETIKKYARKQGVFLIDGSVADFKTEKITLFVDFDWDGATNSHDAVQNITGKELSTQEYTVPVDECIEEFNRKFVNYFNGQSKNIHLTNDQNEDCDYILKFKPMSYTFYQRGGMSGSTTVSVMGFISIESKDNTQIASLYFSQLYHIGSKLGNAGKNRDNTLRTWRCVAEKIDDAMVKLFKKGK